MGLLDKLSDLFGSKKSANLLIVGLDNSGKTSIVNWLKTSDGKTSSSSATVGFTIEKFTAKSINFTIYDMSGQTRYRNLWEHYYREADAIIYCVDSSDRMRIVVSHEELDNMLGHGTLRSRPIPLLVYANKSDVKDALSAADVRAELEIDRIRNRACRVFASSAVNGNGLADGLEWLVQEIRKANSS